MRAPRGQERIHVSYVNNALRSSCSSADATVTRPSRTGHATTRIDSTANTLMSDARAAKRAAAPEGAFVGVLVPLVVVFVPNAGAQGMPTVTLVKRGSFPCSLRASVQTLGVTSFVPTASPEHDESPFA